METILRKSIKKKKKKKNLRSACSLRHESTLKKLQPKQARSIPGGYDKWPESGVYKDPVREVRGRSNS